MYISYRLEVQPYSVGLGIPTDCISASCCPLVFKPACTQLERWEKKVKQQRTSFVIDFILPETYDKDLGKVECCNGSFQRKHIANISFLLDSQVSTLPRAASFKTRALNKGTAAKYTDKDGEFDNNGVEEEEDVEQVDEQGCSKLSIWVRAGVLKRAVGRVLSAINRRSLTNPILDHVLLQAEADKSGSGSLTAMATDGLVCMKCIVEVERVGGVGRVAVKAKTLFDFLSQEKPTSLLELVALPAGGVSIQMGTSASAVLRGLPAHTFPQIPPILPAVKLVVPRGAFRDAILRTRFAAPREDEGRQNLNSVRLTVGPAATSAGATSATLLATDGRVFACVECTVTAAGPPAFEGAFNLPLRSVDEICRLLGGAPKASASRKARELAAAADEEEVLVEVQRERIAVTVQDGSTVSSQLLVGFYPDVMPLLEQEPQVTVNVSRSELSSHLKKVILFSGGPGDKYRSGAVQVTLQDNSMTLEAKSSGLGEYQAVLTVDYTGEPLSIAFNPTLLSDVVQHTSGDSVPFGISRNAGSGVAIFREGNATFVLGALWDSS